MKRKRSRKTIRKIQTALIVLTAILVFMASPVSVLINEPEVTEAEYGCGFTDPGAKGFFGLADARTEGTVDTSVLGPQVITYISGIASRDRVVTVKDTVKPVITLDGPTEITLCVGHEFNETGYSAHDNYDGDITDRVTVISTVDPRYEGSYSVTYEVCDSSGNKIRERRMVSVVKYEPLTAAPSEFDLDPVFDDVILSYTDRDTSENFDSCVFFGDSILGNLGFHGYLPINDNFWSRSSMTPNNIFNRAVNINCVTRGTFFEEYEKRQPDAILILVGTESIISDSLDYFKMSYEKMLQEMLRVCPDTKIIVMSLMPVTPGYDNRDLSHNDKINKANFYLCELCREYHLYFMNAAECLKLDTGAADPDLYLSDGIHPSEEGSRIIVDYIRHHMSYQEGI